jgi:hypothetical protein
MGGSLDLEDIVQGNPHLRRLTWRLGRRLYCAARGEPHPNEIATSGEAYIQKCVSRAILPTKIMTVFDIGANEGQWALSLLDTLRPTPASEVSLYSFEPVPATVQRLRDNIARHPLSHIVRVQQLGLSDKTAQSRMAA